VKGHGPIFCISRYTLSLYHLVTGMGPNIYMGNNTLRFTGWLVGQAFLKFSTAAFLLMDNHILKHYQMKLMVKLNKLLILIMEGDSPHS